MPDVTPKLPIEGPVTPKLLAAYEKEYERAHAKSLRLATRRMELPDGSSRARITSLNAQWSIAAEHRDRLLERLERARAMMAGTS
jgi:hypothetical protein